MQQITLAEVHVKRSVILHVTDHLGPVILFALLKTSFAQAFKNIGLIIKLKHTFN